MTDNRRLSQRFQLYAVDFAQLLVKDEFEAFGTISNVCKDGLQLDLFPTGPSSRPAQGDVVGVLSGPAGLDPLIAGSRGVIAWMEGDRCGIRFDAPLAADEDELRRGFKNGGLTFWAGDAA